MHELAIAQEIIEIASRRANGARIRRLVIEVGKLSCVLPDTLQFWFDMCRQETPASEATLEITEITGLGRCRICGLEVPLESAFALCSCGSSDLEWLHGEELTIKQMEVL